MHKQEGGRDVVTTLVSIDTNTGDIHTLIEGDDFYSYPRLNPSGTHLAFIAWNHPNMPWDDVALRVVAFNAETGLLAKEGDKGVLVSGGDAAGESLTQPVWMNDHTLLFMSDRTDFYNLYQWDSETHTISTVLSYDGDLAPVDWWFGSSNYAMYGDQIVIQIPGKGLHMLDPSTSQLSALDHVSEYPSTSYVTVCKDKVYFVGASPTSFAALMEYDLSQKTIRQVQASSSLHVDKGYISVPESITFPTSSNQESYGYFYPPYNKDYVARTDEEPPLLVKVHGGPTGRVGNNLNLGIQYWTSKGFAVFDVNYGGSEGFGRQYRKRLEKKWGIVDVEETCDGVSYLIGEGLVDPDRAAITGGSAGGFTVLAALANKNVFRAGASHFGVSDLHALAVYTHKFESRYLDGLVAPVDDVETYHSRSPLYNLKGFTNPIIIFQGLDDFIVLPEQSTKMYEAVKEKGVPCAYVEFEGEGHGFVESESIRKALDSEFYFYSRVFGFEGADPFIYQLDIQNEHALPTYHGKEEL